MADYWSEYKRLKKAVNKDDEQEKSVVTQGRVAATSSSSSAMESESNFWSAYEKEKARFEAEEKAWQETKAKREAEAKAKEQQKAQEKAQKEAEEKAKKETKTENKTKEDDIAPVKHGGGGGKFGEKVERNYASDALKDPDFNKYAKQGADIVNPSYSIATGFNSGGLVQDVLSQHIGNPVKFVRDNYKDVQSAETSGTFTEGYSSTYAFMTDEEVNIYNYYLAKYGKDEAKRYLDTIADDLSKREGTERAENANGSWVKELWYAANAGLVNAKEGLTAGLKNIITGAKEVLPNSPLEYADEEMAKDNEGAMKVAHDVSYGVGNMAPSIAVGLINPIAGAATMGVGVAGNTYNEKIEEGYSVDEARGVAVLTGVSEGLLQYAMGGISKLGGKAGGNVLSKIFPKGAEKVAEVVAKVSAKTPRILQALGHSAVEMGKEGTEEALQTYLEPLFDSWVTDKAYEAPDFEDVVYNALIGALTSGVLEGAPSVVGSTVDTIAHPDVNADGYTKDEQSVIDKVTEGIVADREKDGEKLTFSEKQEIADKVKEDLDKGYLDADTLDEMFGGDEYKTYTEAVEQEDALRQEYEELGKVTNPTLAQKTRWDELNATKDTFMGDDNRNALRAKAQEATWNRLKDSRLAETLRERVRANNQFEADPSSYENENARKTVENILGSGLMNNTNRAHEMASNLVKFAEDRNVTVELTDNKKLREDGKAYTFKKDITADGNSAVFSLGMRNIDSEFQPVVTVNGETVSNYTVDYDTGKITFDSPVAADSVVHVEYQKVSAMNGSYDPDNRVITINMDSPEAWQVTVGHEVTHSLEELVDLYTKYSSVLREYAEKKGEYNMIRDAVSGTYNKSEDINREVTAILTSEYLFTDEDFVRNLSTNHRNLFQKIYDEIKHLYKLVTAGSQEARELEKVKHTFEKLYREQADAKANESGAYNEESDTKFSLVTDDETIQFLETQEQVKVYRAMQVIDGKLYPPMAAVVPDGSKQLVEPTKQGEWYRADERPDLMIFSVKQEGKKARLLNKAEMKQNADVLYGNPSPDDIITLKDGSTVTFADLKPKFTLDKGNDSTVPAAYNPYFHTSLSALNDQFSSAFKRPNLVVVEGYIPKSELSSGYKANYAKDSVGETTWHSGPVASSLKGEKARKVFLSRWFKVGRIVPDTEAASMIAETLEGEGLNVPWNVVTPSLRQALEEKGVGIDYKDVKMGSTTVTFDSTQESAPVSELDGQKIDPVRFSQNESDTQYSISYSEDIAKGQKNWISANAAKAHVSAQELEEAQKVTAAMVDVMMQYSSILPEDKIGKVLTKNGSYDRSVENTTICIRTLAYNEFVDKVQEQIGRPLTQMESFLVSQKLYDIATDPQCLYCYVSLDRKSFNEMLLRYMQDRDTVIDKYNKSDKMPATVDALYQEFLNGRKDTKNMKERFNKWIGYADNGTQLLSLADIATNDRQSAINADGGILAEQLKDARAYAQSASWSKIQKDYVAYRDEILKLGDRVVKNLNEHYGMRWYSFSEYSPAFIVENMQQITDAAIRGLKGLSYTKDTDFAEIFAPSGMNINISVFVNRDADGNFFIDDRQSADFQRAIELRDQYPNVGIVATVTDDAALRWAGEQEWSDVIIPFHIVRTGTDVAEYYKWLNYTAESADTISDKSLWDAYVDSLNPKTDAARRKVSKNIYPSEHMNSKDVYLNLCQSRGLTPRFARFAGEDWYMKLVNETRLSADQSTPLKPIFNEDAAKASFAKFVEKGGYEGGWYKDGVDVDAEAGIVAGDVLAGKKANEVSYGRQDNFDPNAIMAKRKSIRGHQHSLSLDSEGRELSDPVRNRFVNSKVRDESGNLKVVYHGTASGEFSIFDKSKGSVEGDFGSGFYFTDNEDDVSEHYEGGGPDFENKVARRAEQIEAEEEIDYDEAERMAREELYKGSHKFEVYLNMENPAVVGETMLFDNEQYLEQYNEDDFADYDEYIAEVEQLVADDIENIIWEVERNTGAYSTEGLSDVLYEAYYEGGIGIEELKAKINDLYLEDENGNLIGNEVARQVIESLGYDGIIDPTVSGKWNMDIDEGTTHYIVFKPNQIKAVTNQSPTDNPDIHRSIDTSIAPIRGGDWRTPVRDLRYSKTEDIAPIAEADANKNILPDDYFSPVPEEMANERQDGILESLDDADAPPEMDAPYYGEESEAYTPEDPFADRDFKGVGKRSVKAYMYEHPEVKPFFQSEAGFMLKELADTNRGERGIIYGDFDGYGAESYYRVYGTKRHTSDDIAYLLDHCHYTYEQIENGLKAIIEDNGAENNAVSKRIEFLLNDRLRDGYVDFRDGIEIPPDQGYLDLLREKEITAYNEEAYRQLFEDESLVPPEEDIAPIAGEQLHSVDTTSAQMSEQTAPKEVQNTPGGDPIAPPPQKSEPKRVKHTTAEILTEEPKVKNRKRGLWSLAKEYVLDNGMVFEEVAKENNNRELEARWNSIRNAPKKAQHFIEHGANGTRSVNAIRQEVEKRGLVKKLSEYMYHMHNIDRMSLESKAKAEADQLLRENPMLAEITVHHKVKDIIAKIEAKTTQMSADEAVDTDLASKNAEMLKNKNSVAEDLHEKAQRYAHLMSVKNKPVFGDEITADVSYVKVQELLKQNPELKQYAEEIYQNNRYLRNMMVEEGVISYETAKLWEEMYPHYVPVRREGDVGLNVNVPLDTRRTWINAPVKGATGGSRNILPLFDTLGIRAIQTYNAIAKNRFGIELMDTMGSTVESDTATLDDAIGALDQSDKLLKPGENGMRPTFTVFDGGERVTFEITDEMYDAMKPTGDVLSYTNKVANTASNLFRGLLTEYNPVFIAKNAIKDVQDVLINSQHPVSTYAAIPRAIVQMAGKGKYFQEYVENGGENNTYFERETSTFTKENKAKAVAKTLLGLNLVSKANNLVEMTPRLAEYIASREAGRSIDVSMLDAARVTTNFAAGGKLTKFLNRNGATFLSASVNGAVQQARNLVEAKQNGVKGVVGLAAKFIAAGLPMVLLNDLIWEDDDEYEELSDYVKQNYYIVGKFGDGKFVRIPKGRTVAVIQEAFAQMENIITGDDEADLGAFLELAVANLAPNNPLEDNIIAPIKQVMENKTWYGEDLVPQRLQDLPPGEQYDESTDEISRWLGEKLNFISPYKVNYLLNQYTGGVGDVVLPMLTPEAESGDDSILGSLLAPIRSTFTTDSVMNNQNVSDFYDKKDELTTNAKGKAATDEDVLMSKFMNSMNAEISALYAQKREVQSSDLPDGVKYQQVRKIQDQIVDLTRKSLSTYEDIKYEGDYAVIGDRYFKKDGDGEWQKLSDDQVTKHKITSAAGDEHYATDGVNHYRLYVKEGETEGEWRKITDKELEKQKEVTSALGITAKEYWKKKDEYTFAYESPAKYEVSRVVGGYDAYKEYQSEMYDIKADKDAEGKSISGSRKEKVIDYINSLDADYGEKLVLFKSEYPADDTYNNEIIDYLNGREDLTYEQMVTILKELGFKVSGNNITW